VAVSEEVELAAKTSADVVTALTEASGALGPSQEFWGAITSGIHYRFYPRVVKQALAAAEKIEKLGLSRRAYAAIPDRLLRTILDGGSLEDDEDMRDRWANLLANALTESQTDVPLAFPTILGELEPIEAATLDALFDGVSQPSVETQLLGLAQLTSTGISAAGLDNLVRLGLLRYTREMPTTTGSITDEGATITGATFTDLGWAFVRACRTPQARE
jgi:Abortive infection alpha